MSEPVGLEETFAAEEKLIDREAADLEIGEHLGAREVLSNSNWQTPHIWTVGAALLLVVGTTFCAGLVARGMAKASSQRQIELRAAQAELLVHSVKHRQEKGEQRCHTAQPGESCYNLVSWSMKVGIREHPTWYHASVTEASSFEEVQASLALAESSGCPDPCGNVHLHYERSTAGSHHTTEEEFGKVVQKTAEDSIENSINALPSNATGDRVSSKVDAAHMQQQGPPEQWHGPGGRPLTREEVNEMEAELNYQGFTNALNDTDVVKAVTPPPQPPLSPSKQQMAPEQWRGPGGRPLTREDVNEMEAELNYQGFTNPLNDTDVVQAVTPPPLLPFSPSKQQTAAEQWHGPGGRPLTWEEVNEMEAELNYQGYTNPLNDTDVEKAVTPPPQPPLYRSDGQKADTIGS